MTPNEDRRYPAKGDTDDFATQLTEMLMAMDPQDLPLAAGCTQGGQVDTEDIQFSVLGREQKEGEMVSRVGVFFSEVVGGCNCHDDPVRSNAYLMIEVSLDGRMDQMDIRVIEDA